MPIYPTPHNLMANRLLAALSGEEYARFVPCLERVRLPQGKVLSDAGDLIKHAYFPLEGIVSLLSTTEDGETIEVAIVGNEGMVGVPIILCVGVTPYRTVMHIAAEVMKVRVDVLKRELHRGGLLQELLLKYSNSFLTQVSQSAVCNRFHRVEPRLCRWLLAARDRLQANSFQLTQEYISEMLGASRTSITTAALNLQNAGVLSYRRGQITVLNERALEGAACECYWIIRKETENFLAAQGDSRLTIRL
jgi:CRP-like cAMP-binding protein